MNTILEKNDHFHTTQLEQLKLAIDQSSIVAITDIVGKIIYVNDLLCQISGYSRDELIGNNHRILKSGAHSSSFFEEMWKSISSGKIWKSVIKNKRKDGSFYWVDTTIVPFLDDNKKPIQYLAIRHDVTALKEAEQTILDQQQKWASAAKLSAIGEMAAAITHEINNPLAVILGRTEMLKRQINKPQFDLSAINRIVDTIELNGMRIEKIVRSMRSISHQERSTDKFETVTIESIIEQTLDLCSERFKNHGYDLRIQHWDVPIKIECHPVQLFQVLLNLLNNSFDAIKNLSQKWVELLVQQKQNNVLVTVTDSGAGISPENIDKIFQPFFSTKEAKYGTGLGLSISKGIIEKHKGTLIYDTKHPFTRFIITLPLKQDPTI